MCEPMTIAAVSMAALGAAGAASSISANNKAAETAMQNSYNNGVLSNNLIRDNMQDISVSTGLELSAKDAEYQRTRASLRTAQAESGLTGASALHDIANTYMQNSFDTSTLVEKGNAEIRTAARGGQAEFNSNMSSYKGAKAKAVTGFNAGLQIASAGAAGGMQGYTAGKSMQ